MATKFKALQALSASTTVLTPTVCQLVKVCGEHEVLDEDYGLWGVWGEFVLDFILEAELCSDKCFRRKSCSFCIILSYILIGHVDSISLIRGGICCFSLPLFLFQGASCQDPGSLANGNRQGDRLGVGSIVTYSCRTGYRLVGESRLVCQSSLLWSASVPTCQGINTIAHLDACIVHTLHYSTYSANQSFTFLSKDLAISPLNLDGELDLNFPDYSPVLCSSSISSTEKNKLFCANGLRW